MRGSYSINPTLISGTLKTFSSGCDARRINYRPTLESSHASRRLLLLRRLLPPLDFLFSAQDNVLIYSESFRNYHNNAPCERGCMKGT